MLQHSSKKDSIKAKEPITKSRNKKYTKTRPKKSKPQDPVLPEPKWWQRNSFYRLLCCQNICYSVVLYIFLVIIIAAFAYAVWKICDLHLVSKLRSKLKTSHEEKGNGNDSRIAAENDRLGGQAANHRVTDNTFKENSNRITTDSSGRNDHRKFKSNDLSRGRIENDDGIWPTSTLKPLQEERQYPVGVPGDKRYIIPPSPPRFKSNDVFDGSGGAGVEEWRAIRYNLLRNRLQLTTSSSNPTESPYWRAWYMSRMNPFASPLVSPSVRNADSIFPVHDDNSWNMKYKSFNTESSSNLPKPTRAQLAKHSRIEQTYSNNSNTTGTAYNKLLQDLFEKISAMRGAKPTTRKPTAPSRAVNATVLQLKLLSALTKHQTIFKSPASGLTNASALEKTTRRPTVASSTSKITTKGTTLPTTTSTTKSSTSPTTMSTTKATTKAATKASTVATQPATTTRTKTTSSTASSTPAAKTRSKTAFKAGHKSQKHKKLGLARHHLVAARRHLVAARRHRSRKRQHSPKARHRSHKHRHTEAREESVYVKGGTESSFEAETSGSGRSDKEDGVGSGSGSGGGSGGGSGEDEMPSEEDKVGSEKNHAKVHGGKSHGYVGLRVRINKLRNKKTIEKKRHRHKSKREQRGRHRKGKSQAEKGEALDFVSSDSHTHKKKHLHKVRHHKGGHKKKDKKKSKHRGEKKNKNRSKHKFMKIVQQKMTQIRKKNQIAKRLKHVQNRMTELRRRKHKKSHSWTAQKREKIAKRNKSSVKILDKPLDRTKEPKHWRKGHLSLGKCATLREFDHNHYVGLRKLWKTAKRNTYVVTECARKGGSRHRYKCQRAFYRTKGYMGLKRGKIGTKKRLHLIACVLRRDLEKSLRDSSNHIEKARISYAKETARHRKKKKKHHKKHGRKKNHGEESAAKRNSIFRHRRKRHHSHRRRKSHRLRKHHKREKESKNHRKRSRKAKKHRVKYDDSDDDDDNDGESGSGSSGDNSGDEEERVERSTTMTNKKHFRRHRGKTRHNHHHHSRHAHKTKHHRLDKSSSNITSKAPNINSNKNSQVFTEFVDLMKEMKQEIRNVSVLNSKTFAKAYFTNTSDFVSNMTSSNRTTNSSIPTNKVRTLPTAKPANDNSTRVTNSINSGTIQDMVAQIVPAIMKQFQAKNLTAPPTADDKKPTSRSTTMNSLTTTSTSTTKPTTKATTTKPTTKATTTKPTTKATTTKPTTKATTTKPTTKATKPTTASVVNPTKSPEQSPHHTTHHPTTLRPKTVTHHPTTRHKSKPHLQTTAAPNLALILKGLKALGLTSIGQHATGKPSQMQKKTTVPSAPSLKRTNTPKAPSAPLKRLPPPIPKPLPLHNRFMMNVLCFGDSLTAGYHDHGKAFAPYGNHLKQLLTLSSRTPVNLKIKGIVGEMTHKQMVSRLPEVLGNSSVFDWVVILGGTNDILHVKNFADDQEFLGQLENVWQPRIAKDIEKLHTIAHNYGAHTMLLTIPENAIEEWPGYRILKTMRTKINNALKQYANQNRNKVALCDIAQKLPRHSLSPQQEALFWDDHLHMTPRGYNRMADEVFKCLKPYMPKGQTTIR